MEGKLKGSIILIMNMNKLTCPKFLLDSILLMYSMIMEHYWVKKN